MASSNPRPDLKQLKAILIKYDATTDKAEDLLVLKDYDIVIIADDSGSMSASLPTGGTRWSELKETVTQILEIACCFDADGTDIYFLNRGDVKGVAKSDDPRLVDKFAKPPGGSTPLAKALERMIKDQSGSKPLLVLIATDGVPDGGAASVIPVIKSSIAGRLKARYQLLACSDREADIKWMNDLDDQFKEVDCTDDYESEKAEVLRVGLVNKFSRCDWLMKALLGPISKKYDALDVGAHRPLQAQPGQAPASAAAPAASVPLFGTGRQRQENVCDRCANHCVVS